MKRRITALILCFGLMMLTACSQTATTGSDITTTEGETVYGTEEQKVLALYEKMQQAMIEKDIETLNKIIKDGTTFTHMSGKVQTKEEYFSEIADGTLNYRRYKIENCKITVDGDKAALTAEVTLTAKVYGISGSWTLPVNAHFEKTGGEWRYGYKDSNLLVSRLLFLANLLDFSLLGVSQAASISSKFAQTFLRERCFAVFICLFFTNARQKTREC